MFLHPIYSFWFCFLVFCCLNTQICFCKRAKVHFERRTRFCKLTKVHFVYRTDFRRSRIVRHVNLPDYPTSRKGCPECRTGFSTSRKVHFVKRMDFSRERKGLVLEIEIHVITNNSYPISNSCSNVFDTRLRYGEGISVGMTRIPTLDYLSLSLVTLIRY